MQCKSVQCKLCSSLPHTRDVHRILFCSIRQREDRVPADQQENSAVSLFFQEDFICDLRHFVTLHNVWIKKQSHRMSWVRAAISVTERNVVLTEVGIHGGLVIQPLSVTLKAISALIFCRKTGLLLL